MKILSRPLSEYDNWKNHLNGRNFYLFICQKGIRSKNLVKKLRQEKFTKSFSLAGGLDSVSH